MFITYHYFLISKEPPSILEMLTMIWFCGIHVRCHWNGFMFNSAWGWQICRKLCWVYGHICKEGSTVYSKLLHARMRTYHIFKDMDSMHVQNVMHSITSTCSEINILMRHPRILCPTPSANGDDIMLANKSI